MHSRLLLLLLVPACSPLLGVASIVYTPRADHARGDSQSDELERIRTALMIPNPVVAGVETRTLGSRIGGEDVIDVALQSYAHDTLCMRFHSARETGSDRPSHFDAGLERAYHLFAPNSVQSPAGAPSISAARVSPVDFDARVASTEYDTSGRDKIVATHRYNVDERFDVCFDHASRVLTSRSTYALVDFHNNTGDTSFRYAWRLEGPTEQTAQR